MLGCRSSRLPSEGGSARGGGLVVARRMRVWAQVCWFWGAGLVGLDLISPIWENKRDR